MGVSIVSHGDYKKAMSYLEKLKMLKIDAILNQAGGQGLEALRAATPRDTGELANSWYYTLEIGQGTATITWCNSDLEGGYNVALLIQYGHGTGTGGYVPPHDYINPAIDPIFKEIARKIGEEVKRV